MGKTTVSLGAAFHWARRGEKVLFLEIGAASSAAPLVGLEALTYTPRSIAPRLFAAKITGEDSLKDYLLRQVKMERIYRLLFENRPVRYFFEVAPALRDLMLLGKIVHEMERPDSPGPYDRIVVDAPATGHGLFLFQTPRTVRELTRFGPLFDRAEWILKTLQNRKITHIHIVSLARPLVVGETLELLSSLQRLDLPAEELVVNRPFLSSSDVRARDLRAYLRTPSADPFYRLLGHRVLSELHEVARLKRRLKLPVTWMPEIDNPTSLSNLADGFQKGRNDV